MTTENDMNSEQARMFLETNRLATFKNWPYPNISPQSLAKAGFYCRDRMDEVRCVWCRGNILIWGKNDNLIEEHKRAFPECPRVILGPHVEFGHSRLSDLGIIRPTPSKKPEYSSLDARLRSFAKWPISHVQQPEALAEAGLYYEDNDDLVRCFHCNIGLRSWIPQNEPWLEHAKWSPKCTFLQLVKGPDYIKEVNDGTVQASTSTDTESVEHVEPLENSTLQGDENELVKEIRKLKDARLCKVCLDREVCILFLPCGHLVTCNQCGPVFQKCPMCKATIKAFVRAFLP